MINKILKELLLYFIKTNESNYYAGRTKLLSNEYVLDLAFFILKSGSQWNNLTVDGGAWKTVYNRYRMWVNNNIFKQAYTFILKAYSTINNVKYYATDTTLVKSILGNDIVGKNPTDRGRNGSKISVIVDDLGIPWSIQLHEANRNDCILLDRVLEKPFVPFIKNKNMYGDKGYDSTTCREQTTECGLNPIIAKRGKVSPKEYEKSRYIVENSFSWLKQYKRVRVRDDIKAKYYLSWVFFAYGNILLNKFE